MFGFGRARSRRPQSTAEPTAGERSTREQSEGYPTREITERQSTRGQLARLSTSASSSRGARGETSQGRGPRAHRHPLHSAAPRLFSENSTPAVPDSTWFATDFMTGAGMVIIQPSSGRVVLLYETAAKYWFLPKGRKDVGESLEQAALREAYEEVRREFGRTKLACLFMQGYSKSSRGTVSTSCR